MTEPYTPLKPQLYFEAITASITISIQLYNVYYVLDAIRRLGFKNYTFTLVYMITFLISVVSVFASSFLKGLPTYSPEEAEFMFRGLRINNVVRVFFTHFSIAGVALLSLHRYDTVLPHSGGMFRAWKMRFIYGLHFLICIASFIFVASRLAVRKDLQTIEIEDWISALLIVWCTGCELIVTALFLQELSKIRLKVIETIGNNTGSTAATTEKMRNLKKLIFFLRASASFLLALALMYVASQVFIRPISPDWAWSITVLAFSSISLYFTFILYQKKIVSSIFRA